MDRFIVSWQEKVEVLPLNKPKKEIKYKHEVMKPTQSRISRAGALPSGPRTGRHCSSDSALTETTLGGDEGTEALINEVNNPGCSVGK